MCGIVGQSRGDGAPAERGLIEAMCQAQEHRGPDSRGVHVAPGVGLGIQRLRIIDLATGDQPIFNEDSSIVVVLNGEIYNYKELRERLERKGHRFRTSGDTEAIVHLYEEEGVECVRSLHGMFGFALWDSRKKRLLIGRDRVGKKPLFYSERNGTLSFASELNALMQDPTISRDVDHEALDHYLAYGYVPAPRSAFRAVRKLEPGHRLVHQNGVSTIERYWHLDHSAKRDFATTEELHEEIRDGIRKAVRKRMVADVPLGAFLSGGIDSSAVVAAMAEASTEPIKTFSIGFDEKRYNELPRARQVAEAFGTDHHELVVQPDAASLLPKIVRHYGEPFGDHSALACFYLAEMARKHVTVALNGDGGDEGFAGYQRYSTNLMLHRFDRIPGGARRMLAGAAAKLPGTGDPHAATSRLLRLARAAGNDPAQRFINQQQVFTGADRQALYSQEFSAFLGPSTADEVLLGPWHAVKGGDLVDRMLEVDVATYLPGDLLAKIDIATMAYSLEGRSPLLDHEFLELAASIPSRHKVRGVQRKIALKDALRGWVPDTVLDGPKRGFEVPVSAWFRGELREHARDVLLDPSATSRGMFDTNRLETMLDRHAAGVEDHGRQIWSLLLLEMWQRQVVDEQPAEVGIAA